MGFNIELVTFDYNLFQNQILPALREGEENELVKETEEWINEHSLIYHSYEPGRRPNYRGLKQLVAASPEDLSSTPFGLYFRVIDGEIIENHKFEKHIPGSWTRENLADLFQAMLFRNCIHHYLNFGKHQFLDLFFNGITSDLTNYPAIQRAIHQLQQTYRYHIIDSGMTGILSPEDTKQFYEELKAMKVRSSLSDDGLQHYDRLLRIAEIAVDQNLGLLAGQDLRITVYSQQRSVLKLIPSDHISGDGCVCFAVEQV